MLIKLTQSKGKLDLYIEHGMIRVVERAAGNPMVTQVMTNVMTPGGMLAYEVTESPALVADAVNEAYKGNTPSPLIQH